MSFPVTGETETCLCHAPKVWTRGKISETQRLVSFTIMQS